MKVLRLARVPFVVVTVLVLASGISFAQLMMAPPNPAYQQWVRDHAGGPVITERGYALGDIPHPFKGPIPPVAGRIRAWGAYPTAYDLRGVSGKIPPVRDQGACGSCWAFATMASLETYLRPGDTTDLSENNLRSLHGWDYGSCSGGHPWMSAAYLGRWGGPVLESQDPYTTTEPTNPPSPVLPPYKHVQEVLFLPAMANAGDQDTIKDAVISHGAVYANYEHNSSYYNTTASGTAFYYPGATSTNHAVSIIGWDDTFAASDFKVGSQPPGNGAWLVRNSWGAGWGDAGYFWISYHDPSFGKNTVATFHNAEPTTNYDHNYQHDPLGNFTAFNNPYSANVFQAAGDENIAAVAFYTEVPGANYTVRVYRNPVSPPAGGAPALTQTGSFAHAGYHTVPLSTPVGVAAGGIFSIAVHITNSGQWPSAAELAWPGVTSNATASPGQSYYSFDGINWTDFTISFSSANFCIKAFTSNNTAPSNPTGVNIIPTSPLTGDALVASAGGSTDPDPGTTITYQYQWASFDGSSWSLWGNDGATLAAANTTKGEQWKARARATDGVGYSGWVESAAVTIGNTAPTVPTNVAVSPGAPDTADDLTGLASGSTDADTADTIGYEYQWSSFDGSVWSAWGNDGETLAAANTTRDEQWKVRARATDGTDHSAWVESTAVTIGNSTPTAPATVTIAPAAPDIDEDLTASATGSTDADQGDTISYEFQWASNSGSGWSTWGYDGPTLPGANTAPAQQWKARGRATDGTDYSAWTESAPVTVHGVVISAGPSGAPNAVYSGEAVACSVTASDNRGHDLVYAWSAAGDAGSFDDPTAASPTWTAPANTTQAVAEYEITVTVSCAQNSAISDSASYVQKVDPVHEAHITAGPAGNPNPVYSGNAVELSVAAEETLGHDLLYAWSAEGGAGSFDDATSQTPTWTAPANTTQAVAEYEITVTVTCAEDASVSATATYDQSVDPVHELAITAGPTGDPLPVASGGAVQCSVTAEDTLGHDLIYEWSAEEGAGSFDDASAPVPTWTAPVNATQLTQYYVISVTVTCPEDNTLQATASYTQAVSALHEVQISAGPVCDPNPVHSDGSVECSVTAADTLGHDVTYDWSAEGGAGSFDDASSRTPMWTAPSNISPNVVRYELTVTITCVDDPDISTTASCTARVMPHEVVVAAGPAGDPNAVYSQGAVQCSVDASDSLGHGLTYAWSAEGGAGSFDDPTSASPTWSAPSNTTQDVQDYEITVTITCVENDAVTTTVSYIQRVDPVHVVSIVAEPASDQNPLYWQGTVGLSVTCADTLEHDLTYEWSAAGDAGSFDDPTSRTPTWTAPPNETENVQDHRITVTVSCAEEPGVSTTATFVQRVEPRYEVTITDGPFGDPDPVVSGSHMVCTVHAEDSWGRQLSYAWSAEDESGDPAGSFDDPDTRRPLWTAPEVSVPTTCTLTVMVTSTVDAEITDIGTFEQQVLPCVSHMFAPGLQMVSMPTTPGRAASLRELLGADRTALWDAARQEYVPDRSDEWDAGIACWALFGPGSQHHARVSGTPYEGTTYSCDARQGWNQLGLPWVTDVPVRALSSDGAGFRRIAWTYHDGGYHLIAEMEGIPGVSSTLEAWRSYWVYTPEDCHLTVSPDAEVTQSAPIDLRPDDDSWLVQLVASTSQSADRHNYCGVTSADGGLSVANPPAVDGSVDLFFTPATGTQSAIELASGLAADSCEWAFSVRGVEAGQEVSLSCPDLSRVPNTHSVYLQDLDTGQRVYMRTRSSYSYTAASDAERHFTLTVARRSDAPVAVSGMDARQTSSQQVAMQFTLSVDAAVEIEIMNIAGRRVRQLVGGAQTPAGPNTCIWNLRTGDGTMVPGGLYLVRLVARADDGSQVSALATLRVDR